MKFLTRFLKKDRSEIVWTSRDGRKIAVKEMDYAHAVNVLLLLENAQTNSAWVADTKLLRAVRDRVNECEGKMIV